jgi:hypothetical protein
MDDLARRADEQMEKNREAEREAREAKERRTCDKCGEPAARELQGINSFGKIEDCWTLCDACYKKAIDLLAKDCRDCGCSCGEKLCLSKQGRRNKEDGK